MGSPLGSAEREVGFPWAGSLCPYRNILWGPLYRNIYGRPASNSLERLYLVGSVHLRWYYDMNLILLEVRYD